MPRDQPNQSYYPRAKVRLFIRLEEGASKDLPETPKKPTHLRGGKTEDNPEVLTIDKDGSTFILRPLQSSAGNTNPYQDNQRSTDNRTFVIDNVIPTRATLTRNGVRTADTLSVSFRWLDLPLDPRAIRSLGIELYIGCIDPILTDEQSAPIGCPAEFTDTRGRIRSNLRFQGFADLSTIKLSDDMGMVEVEATDNTRILIDQDAPSQLTIAADVPIDRAIASYLARFPQFVGFRIEYRPSGAEVPSLGDALAKSSFRPKLGPAPSGGAAGGGGGSTKITVWDYLTDVCGALGLMCRLENTTIIIQRPRTLWASKFSGRPDDPFTGRILPSGREIIRRLFIYGENIDSFEMKRKFVRWTSVNIEVRCYSALKGRTLVARYPSVVKAERSKKPLPGNANDEKWIVHTVHGIDDEETLKVIAQGIYESLARTELNLRFSTISLGSFGGSNGDPDALDMQAGDSVDFEMKRAPEELGTAGEVANAIATRASSFLVNLGYVSADFAAAYQRAINQLGLIATYRVRSIGIDWDSEQGVQLDIEASNFLEVRADRNLPTGQEIEPPNETPLPPEQIIVGS